MYITIKVSYRIQFSMKEIITIFNERIITILNERRLPFSMKVLTPFREINLLPLSGILLYKQSCIITFFNNVYNNKNNNSISQIPMTLVSF
jgi:hypothetical protein